MEPLVPNFTILILMIIEILMILMLIVMIDNVIVHVAVVVGDGG